MNDGHADYLSLSFRLQRLLLIKPVLQTREMEFDMKDIYQTSLSAKCPRLSSEKKDAIKLRHGRCFRRV